MYNLNRVQLIGHLGSDPEVRYTSGGKAVANFNVATNSHWTDDNGVRQSSTQWTRVVVWDQKAEACREHLRKGSYVYIEGKIQTRSWEDRDGKKRWMTEVVVSTLGYLEKKAEQGSNYEPPMEPPPPSDDDYNDDDIPF